MRLLQKTALIFSLFLFSNFGFSQVQDSLNQSATKRLMAYATDKFAVASPLSVSFNQLTPYDFKPKVSDTHFPKSEITNFSQIKATANLNFIKKQKWLFGASFGYEYTNLSSDINTPSSISHSYNNDFHYHYSSLNFSYFSKLFNKPAIFSASFAVDGSDKHFERARGLVTGVIVLKADMKTKMTVGLVGIIDPSAQVPAVPIFSYEYKFNNGWTADIILPQRFLMKKNVHSNGRLSLGTELGRTGFYIYNLDGTSQKYELRQVDLNSGVIYEHLLGKNLVLTAKTGIRYSPNSRIFEKGKSFDDYYIDLRPQTSFYFNVGISFNPFKM